MLPGNLKNVAPAKTGYGGIVRIQESVKVMNR
jgi:hypothetical protein